MFEETRSADNTPAPPLLPASLPSLSRDRAVQHVSMADRDKLYVYITPKPSKKQFWVFRKKRKKKV